VGAFPTYNISDLKAFTFQTFADIEAEDGRRLIRVLHGQLSRYVKENTAPPNAGVLVIGGDATKKPEYDTTASVKARKWKSFSRKFREAKT
jgi:hypothetical protein